MKTKVITLIAIVLAFTSCRKYEEGGFYILSNMSKKIAGWYNFTHYYIDGVDSANYYFNNDYTVQLDIGYDQQDNTRELTLKFWHNSNEISKYFGYVGYWNWNKNSKKEIELKFNDRIEYGSISNPLDTTINNGPFSPNTKIVWDVLKLKKGELILETGYNNKHYRAELKKIE